MRGWIALLLGLIAACPGYAANQVDAYGNSVERNAKMDDNQPNRSVSAGRSVLLDTKSTPPRKIGERIRVIFTRPRGYRFRRFTDEEKKPLTNIYKLPIDWVDIVAAPNTRPETLREGFTDPSGKQVIRSPNSNEIMVQADFHEPTTAAQFPISCEGNLEKPTGRGGYQNKQTWHWASDVVTNGVDIDVDWNRDGKIDRDDDEHEADPVDFLAENGALVLVNCDKDNKGEGRDMDDLVIANADDLADMSPISIELKRDLERGEHLYLVIKTVGESTAWGRVMDKELMGKDDADHSIVNEQHPEIRLDNLKVAGLTYFPKGKRVRYDNRFYVEGLRFAKELELRLEIRKGSQVIDSDVVRILTTPWLANNNLQPLANVKPGNLINSRTFPFQSNHGARLTKQGRPFEFVQDSCEWGFQLRRAHPPQQGRGMITALRLYVEPKYDSRYPLNFLGPNIGVYGYDPESKNGLDEDYFSKVAESYGDAGGNLECLPPSKEYPFGRLIYGDTMSMKLRNFLKRQKAQVKNGPVVLNISSIGLKHVDEFICVVPITRRNGRKAKADDYVVIVPDWREAYRIVSDSNNEDWNFGIGGMSYIDNKNKTQFILTYLDLRKYLQKDDEGKLWNEKMPPAIKEVQRQVARAVPRGHILKLPVMFLPVNVKRGDWKRSFPRNVANSQPVSRGQLIVPMPPQETRRTFSGKTQTRESRFYVAWKKALAGFGVKVEGENVELAWRTFGEVHCASNTIRKVLKK